MPAGLFLQESLKYDQFGQLMEGVAASAVLASSPSTFLAYLEVRPQGRRLGRWESNVQELSRRRWLVMSIVR